MHCLATISDTGTRPNFLTKNELPNGFEIQIFPRSLPYICKTSEIPLRMLGLIKLRVYLGHTRVAFKSIVCNIVATSANIRDVFCHWHLKAIRFKQMLVDLDSGSWIPIVWNPRGQPKARPPLHDELTYLNDNLRVSPMLQVAEKLLSLHTMSTGLNALSLHSRTSRIHTSLSENPGRSSQWIFMI